MARADMESLMIAALRRRAANGGRHLRPLMPPDADPYPDVAYVEHLIETSTDKVLAAETVKLLGYVQQAWADGYNAPHPPAGHPISSAESSSLHTEGGLSAYPRRNT